MKYIIKATQNDKEYYLAGYDRDIYNRKRMCMSTMVEEAIKYDTRNEAGEDIKSEYLAMLDGNIERFIQWASNTSFEIIEIEEKR